MSDQFDKMDKGDFDALISKANQCIAARDFNCAETQLRAARKLTNDSKSKSTLKRAEDAALAEKERIREEERVIAQRQRELEKQEERMRQAEQQARDAEYQAQRDADEGANLNSRIAAAGNVYAHTIQAQANIRAQEQARTRQFEQRQVEANAAAREQQSLVQQRAQAAQQRADEQRRQSQQIAQQREELATRERAAASKPQGQTIAANDVQSAPGSGSSSSRSGASSTEHQTESSPEDGDIREPNPYIGRGKRVWRGAWFNRQATSSRLEACQISERLREAQIALDGQGSRPTRAEQRSECVCTYKAFTKAWFCSTWYLPVGSPVDVPGMK